MIKSSSRNGAKIVWLGVHTGEGATRAQAMYDYFDRDAIRASSHAIIDADVTLACVPDYRAAWTMRSANPKSLNVETCGFAEMTREQWLSESDVTFPAKAAGGRLVTVRRPRQMLRRLATWLAEKCRAHDIPPIKLTVAQLAAGHSGIIGHRDWTEAMHDGTHQDPESKRGTFPWDVVMAEVAAVLNPQATQPEQEDDVIVITAQVPAYVPPPPEERQEGVDYSARLTVPLPDSPYGFDCYIASGAVANIRAWTWLQQDGLGVIRAWPAIDRMVGDTMGEGTFDLQPGVRHGYPGHTNFTGVQLRSFRNPQPITMVCVERKGPIV